MSLPPCPSTQPVGSALILTMPPEQPLLLQRRLPHLAPPASAPSLARPPGRLSPATLRVRRPAGPRLPRHRLRLYYGPSPAQGLRHAGTLPRTHRCRAGGHDTGGARCPFKAAYEGVHRAGDQGEVQGDDCGWVRCWPEGGVRLGKLPLPFSLFCLNLQFPFGHSVYTNSIAWHGSVPVESRQRHHRLDIAHILVASHGDTPSVQACYWYRSA